MQVRQRDPGRQPFGERFEVQQLNGQPVPGEYQIKVNMYTRDALPKRFIGKDQRL